MKNSTLLKEVMFYMNRKRSAPAIVLTRFYLLLFGQFQKLKHASYVSTCYHRLVSTVSACLLTFEWAISESGTSCARPGSMTGSAQTGGHLTVFFLYHLRIFIHFEPSSSVTLISGLQKRLSRSGAFFGSSRSWVAPNYMISRAGMSRLVIPWWGQACGIFGFCFWRQGSFPEVLSVHSMQTFQSATLHGKWSY